MMSISVWAWDGYGHSKNLKKPEAAESGNVQKYSVIVSRSHSGTVEEMLKSALDNVEITQAGGAGNLVLLLTLNFCVCNTWEFLYAGQTCTQNTGRKEMGLNIKIRKT